MRKIILLAMVLFALVSPALGQEISLSERFIEGNWFLLLVMILLFAGLGYSHFDSGGAIVGAIAGAMITVIALNDVIPAGQSLAVLFVLLIIAGMYFKRR